MIAETALYLRIVAISQLALCAEIVLVPIAAFVFQRVTVAGLLVTGRKRWIAGGFSFPLAFMLASVKAPDNPHVQANLQLLAKRSGRAVVQ